MFSHALLEKRIFFVAALTEMSENEKQLATDPNCSLILERMMYSMDDFVRRVFMDRLAGSCVLSSCNSISSGCLLCFSYDILVKHRFASHVCQTLFTIAADTISREVRTHLLFHFLG
jgi:nucleolar protein 9